MSDMGDSDDEIFFGPLTRKQIKKYILKCTGPSKFGENKDVDNIKTDPDASIKIIETHSEPNLRPIKEEKTKNSSVPGSPIVNVKTPSEDSFTMNVQSPSDDSFLQIENMVSNLCVSPKTSDNIKLNNTLEIVEYILKNAPKQEIITDTAVKGNLRVIDKQTNI